MPGRTPDDAVRAFLAPLQRGLKVLDGHAKLTIAKKGSYRKGRSYEWSINSEAGMRLGRIGTFYASMRFEIVDSKPEEHDPEHQGEFRCSTRGYNYKLSPSAGDDHWRLHWHPVGPSPIKGPHIHFPPNFDRHLPSPRFTFEQAITWLIEFDVPLRVSREEALAELAEIEAAHVLHRTCTDVVT
jgi:hypothetical protein